MSHSNISIHTLMPVFEAAGVLKSLPRSGWRRIGIPNGESVADHSYRLSIMAALIAPRLGLDPEKAVRLALFHDLPEARAGDVTPAEGVTPSVKHAREATALSEIVANAPDGSVVYDWWREYVCHATAEARFVHELDKLEMALQTLDYERTEGVDLQEFWQSARAALEEPTLIEFYDWLYQQRPCNLRPVTATAPASSPK
ncbi:MAG TPA: HD domain-containing protein [Chloroflexota bacterium]|nr:HD domain-containing protein [Chloroflexota bacterium]